MLPSTKNAASQSTTWSRAAGFIASCAISAPGSRPHFLLQTRIRRGALHLARARPLPQHVPAYWPHDQTSMKHRLAPAPHLRRKPSQRGGPFPWESASRLQPFGCVRQPQAGHTTASVDRTRMFWPSRVVRDPGRHFARYDGVAHHPRRRADLCRGRRPDRRLVVPLRQA